MHIIDLSTSTRLSLAQVNRLPRIAGRTQITAKTHPIALADNALAREPETERPGPDYDLAPPQLVDGKVLPQQWIKRVVTPAERLAQAKQQRQQAADAIVVTTAAGRAFDGNESAQNRMARAIVGLTDTDRIPWVLADNAVTEITRAELEEALRLAGQEQARLWVLPYAEERE